MTLPGAVAVHHVAYTVPDLDQAVRFFVDVLGAREVYTIDRVAGEGDWMTRKLDVHPRATARIAMLRLGPVTNLELFEYTSPDQRRVLPRNSDWGGHHLAIHVEDVDAAAAHLRTRPGVVVMGEPETITEGPITGDRWVYFRTPWGMQLELINLPPGAPYEQRTAHRLYRPTGPWSTE
ncbi:VOC family protein [Actinokineospora sp. PR83]|uniref:VOC family protein n=1 Tax=Actinokineospora sp. PR83 TaxID=2884908 RepID=UPI0027DF519D|nr:VOC family protein [Actinokineospora sp. PR83]MCG8915764.1 VOC family protein [Actinokineospora sp. PR83]